jgi:arsenite methyltransferase
MRRRVTRGPRLGGLRGRPCDPARPPVTRTFAPSGRDRFQYGLDAPGPLVASGVVGIVAVAVGLTVVRRALWPGLVLVAYAGGHLWGSTIGKVRAARRLLGAIPWRGDELVLDVGCGHGLFLVEAARHLTTGTAVGIDVWSQKDQWHNRPAAAIENARRAGVIGRVHVHDADARHLPFPDATFDVVVSSLVIHNIPGREDRALALQEIVRVLKPNGHVVIVDLAHTAHYAHQLRAAGLVDVRRSMPMPQFFLTARSVTAIRREASRTRRQL